MKSKTSSRKSSPKKSKSRQNSTSEENEVIEPKPAPVFEPPKIDGQHLTESEINLVDVDLEVANPDDAMPFIPDDASTDMEAEHEAESKLPVLTKKMITKSLINLNTSANGTQHVFLNLTLPGYGFEHITAVESFPHLQKVDLSFNNIKDASPLGSLPYLIELDVSHNEITTVLGFNPPFNLQEANFSYNQITEMRELTDFTSLRALNLDHNNITEIFGLNECKGLTELNLGYNKITNINGLNGLDLQKIGLSHNSISQIEGIETLKKLQFIDLSGNNISRLNGLEEHHVLTEIDLQDNAVESISEVEHIKSLKLLRKLNLTTNPITNLDDYRLCILFQVSQLTELDNKPIKVEEKVSAANIFDSPPELLATLDHITQTVYNFLQPKKIYECTLPNLEMPYPMLVLTGPLASGKQDLTHRLIQEFPDFFGKGISHTTRAPHANEIDGKDYFFVTKEGFHSMVRQGCFIQTYKCGSDFYGLSIDAIENVAKEGLACIVHMEIEGVRTLRNTHFEPRFVLVMPFDQNVHRDRMMLREKYSIEEIDLATNSRAKMYIEINQNNPGFFDMTINSSKLGEAYDRLRQLVMDYLGLSDADTTADANATRLSTTIHKDETNTQHTTASGNIRRNWSRPSFAVDSSASNDASSTKRSKAIKTPVEEASIKRRENAAKQAIEGVTQSVYDSFFPRPMIPMTAPAVLEGSPYTQAISLYHDPSFVAAALYPTYGPKHSIHSDSSSDIDQNSSSGLSGFSSARGFSELENEPQKSQNLEDLEKSLDLSALTDALDSLKGSLSTPPPPRSTNAESMNVKAVLPPITTQ